MAEFNNIRKKFNWSITLTNSTIGSFLFQKVTLPDQEIEQVEHGESNHSVKTPGRVTVGNMICEKLMPSDAGDARIWAWFDACQSSSLGGGEPAANVKHSAILQELNEDGSIILNEWQIEGIWPARLPGMEFDRSSSDNTIENIEFSVDTIAKS